MNVRLPRADFGEQPQSVLILTCRIYDTYCINPLYCNDADACCAGDMRCVPIAQERRALSERIAALEANLSALVDLVKRNTAWLPHEDQVVLWWAEQAARES